ncbi:MAG: hypothetical protein EXR11_11135 [Rhodospirillaceae bacterium]|nr:hypothetical protein [Rhodospirillaceae bacterium]
MRVAKIIAAVCAATGLWCASVQAADTNDKLQADIIGVLNDMAGRWAANTWTTIPNDLWDKTEPMPMYLAEEQAGWLVGWEQVNGYFDPKRAGFMQAANYEASNVQARLIAPDLAVATWSIYWQMKLRPTEAIGEKLRASGIFRKTVAGWKFIHYAESPKSPSVYIEELYHGQVSPDFRKRVEELKAKK